MVCHAVWHSLEHGLMHVWWHVTVGRVQLQTDLHWLESVQGSADPSCVAATAAAAAKLVA
jgi:hypothetical protein